MISPECRAIILIIRKIRELIHDANTETGLSIPLSIAHHVHCKNTRTNVRGHRCTTILYCGNGSASRRGGCM